MCGSHRHRHRSHRDDLEQWEARFASPTAVVPTPPRPDPDRPVADGDKEVAVAALRRHAGDGTIDLDDFGDRTEQVLAATTAAELEAVFADLPGAPPPIATSGAPARPARVRRSHHPVPAALRSVAPLALLLVTIWALTGMGYFWPAWPILGVTFFSLKHRAHRCGPPHWA